ncbi:MAG: hypothetical protein JWL63_1725 [Rhodocyclales bacterium]|nr:hypothetical protein [Rhodocyclales bacterium]
MKVFISWSGPLSRRFGEALREWLPGVVQLVTPYFTPSDIEKGARWSAEIAKELSEAQIGILCITRENLHSDWILFEAGALSKSLEKSHVCPILFGITNTDLSGPLKQFQTTEFEKVEFHKLIGLINSRLGDQKLPPKTLDNVFEKWWPDLEKRVQAILADVREPEEPIRSDRDILEEILQINRLGARRSRSAGLSPGVVHDLLEKYIALHDEQVNEDGGYQSTLDSLQQMHRAVSHIVSRYAGSSDEMDKLISRFKRLSYKTRYEDEEDDADGVF